MMTIGWVLALALSATAQQELAQRILKDDGVTGGLIVSAKRFTPASPLGLNVEDIEHLNRMPEQKMLELGFMDVTAPPFSADPSGKQDATKAINDAVFFARHHRLAVWFTAGDYRVSDTIRCNGAWSDYRTPNHKFLPYSQAWPCVLMGDQTGKGRARIVLAEKSTGFDNPERPKCVFVFNGCNWHRKNLTDPPGIGNGATAMHQTLLGLDLLIRPGNPGAAGVDFDDAEGSTVQDCVFEMGDGYSAFTGGPGSGGAVFNVTVHGGRIGASLLLSGRPTCTLVGCRFEGQSEAAVDYAQRCPLNLVGCEFKLPRGVPVLRMLTTKNPAWLPSGALVDCRIEYPDGDAPSVCVDSERSVYMRGVWAKNGSFACRMKKGGDVGELGEGWRHIQELAAEGQYPQGHVAGVWVDGKKLDKPCVDIRAGAEPPADIRSRHIWSVESFPAWNDPKAINVKTVCGAKGDGETDDTAALQKAMDENEIVFLPRGCYRVSKTLRLRANTKLIGVNEAYSMLVPRMGAGSDFNDLDQPRPVIRTADAAAADTQLAWFSVFMPRELAPGSYMIDWACGGASRMRNVSPIRGYTILELEPLAKGIYPWHNWRWKDFDFPEALGPVIHYEDRKSPPPPGMDKEAMPNHPIALVHGHGAGNWYTFVALDGRHHGPDYRRILVKDCPGPFRVYEPLLQYCRGKAEMEIANSRHIEVYGGKNEKTSIFVWIHDSENVQIIGFGGIGQAAPGGKFLVENCRDTTLALLIDGLNPKVMIREIAPDGTEITTPGPDRISMYKRK